jgi:hypothetical protein
MRMLLNRTYRVVYQHPLDPPEYLNTSFTVNCQTALQWHDMLEHLKTKQTLYPHRNYRLQIWYPDEQVWKDYATTSKYALFSAD